MLFDIDFRNIGATSFCVLSRTLLRVTEKKAEIGVDERFRAKNEVIKTYFDSNISKLLMGSGETDKYLALGREISAL